MSRTASEMSSLSVVMKSLTLSDSSTSDRLQIQQTQQPTKPKKKTALRFTMDSAENSGHLEQNTSVSVSPNTPSSPPIAIRNRSLTHSSASTPFTKDEEVGTALEVIRFKTEEEWQLELKKKEAALRTATTKVQSSTPDSPETVGVKRVEMKRTVGFNA